MGEDAIGLVPDAATTRDKRVVETRCNQAVKRMRKPTAAERTLPLPGVDTAPSNILEEQTPRAVLTGLARLTQGAPSPKRRAPKKKKKKARK